MLDTNAIIDMFRTHLDADDAWKLSGKQRLEFLRALETIDNLLTAAQADVAAQAEGGAAHGAQLQESRGPAAEHPEPRAR
jgi:hypothetical protein